MLPTRPHEVNTHMFTPAGPFSNALRDVLTDRLSVAQYHNFLKGFHVHNDYLGNENFCRWKGNSTGFLIASFEMVLGVEFSEMAWACGRGKELQFLTHQKEQHLNLSLKIIV